MTDDPVDPETRWEERLAFPVLVAALASIPAVFLTLLDDPYATAGMVTNWAAGAVLVAETVVLFVVSGDRVAWLRRHIWLVLLTVAVVISVVLAIGPVQLLRLLRVVGALRLVRAGRIVKAGRMLQERLGLTGKWQRVPGIAASVLVGAFVAVVLADPSSRTRVLIEEYVGVVPGTIAVLLAGLLLAVATFVVVRQRQKAD